MIELLYLNHKSDKYSKLRKSGCECNRNEKVVLITQSGFVQRSWYIYIYIYVCVCVCVCVCVWERERVKFNVYCYKEIRLML